MPLLLAAIENVSNFAYRSDADFSGHWETRRYDLDALRGSDLAPHSRRASGDALNPRFPKPLR